MKCPEPNRLRTRGPVPLRRAARLVGLLAGLLLVTQAAAPLAADVLNRIVLRVNDRIATLEDYEQRRAQLLGELLQQGLPPEQRREQIEELGERVYRDIYEELLLLSRADQLQIEITDNQLDRVLDQMQEQMGIPDRAALRTAVEQSGLDFNEFQEQWRSQLRMREVITLEVEMPIQEELEEGDLRSYYRSHPEQFRVPEQYKLREVVVLDDSGLSETERGRLAQAIRDQLARGQSLDEIVAPHAEEGATSDVIDLGWIQTSELSSELEEAITGLEPGEVTEPVPARGGLHVCLVEDYQPPSLRPFDEVKNQILRAERRRLRDERVPEYMEGLEEISYIRIDPPPDAQGFRQVSGTVAGELPELPEEEAAAATEPGTAGEATAEPAEGVQAPPPPPESFPEVTVEVPVGGAEAEEPETPEDGTPEEEPEDESPPGSRR